MKDLLFTLLEISFFSAVMWSVIAGLRRLLGDRLSPRFRLALWTLLVIRLIVPFTLDTDVRLFPQVALPETMSNPVVAEGADLTYSNARGASSETRILSSAYGEENEGSSGAREMEKTSADRQGLNESLRQQTSVSIDIPALLIAIWIGGIVVSLAHLARARLALRKDAAEAENCGDDVCALFEACAEEIGLQGRVRLSVQAKSGGPALLFPNTVILPVSAAGMDPAQLRLVFLHELTHFRRRDQYVSLLLGILRAVWWFNPFAWLSAGAIRADVESACDNAVVRGFDADQKAEYARTVLSLFDHCRPVSIAAVGMAAESARKETEERIRRIFGHAHSNKGAAAVAVLGACIMLVACFTTACQPTPAREAVVNQASGLPQGALASAESSADAPDNAYLPVEYKVLQHWKTASSEDESIRLEADVNVLTPDIDAVPVEKLEKDSLDQGRADRMIEYFAGEDASFVQLPVQRTKAEWEEYVLYLRQLLASAKSGGDGDMIIPEDIPQLEAELAEAEEAWANAPEQPAAREATTQYTFARDLETGEANETSEPIYIDIGVIEEESAKEFHVVADTDQHAGLFQFSSGLFNWPEHELRSQIEANERMTRQADKKSEPDRSELLEEFQEQREQDQALLDVCAQNTLPHDEAMQKAVTVFQDLDLDGVQILRCENSAYIPCETLDNMRTSEGGTFVPGVYVEFVRECGGVPCDMPTSGMVPDDLPSEGLYSAPFKSEWGYLVFNQSGEVVEFNLHAPARVVETVASDTEQIAFEEAAERLKEHVGRIYAPWVEDGGLEVDVVGARLVSAYINAKDELSNALLVPAWRFDVKIYTATDERNDPLLEETAFLISALDGSPILMPGTLQDPGTSGV